MILQSLDQLYERLRNDTDYQIAQPGYSAQKIAFKVVLRPDGTLFGIQDARVDSGGKRIPRQLICPGGSKPTGAVTDDSVHKKVLPLRNDLAFLVGASVEEIMDPATKAKSRVVRQSTREFHAFKKYHLDAEAAVNDPTFSTVCAFLRSWNPESVLDHQDWAELPDGQGVFQIQGEPGFVHERPAFSGWWDGQQMAASAMGAAEAQCLISGKVAPIARIHPSIKGVMGGQTTGGAIVGFNEAAYESYAKEQSFNAPVSELAAFRYTTALNTILDGPKRNKHRIIVGDTTVAFWTDRPTATEDIFAQFASEGSGFADRGVAQDETLRQKLELFLNAMRKGLHAYAELENEAQQARFFLLGLSPNAARVSIRFFCQGSLAELLENLRKHYSDCGITPQPAAGKFRGDPELPPTWLLLDQTAPRKGDGRVDREKIPPILAGPLLRAVVTGCRYPDALFLAVLRRLRSDSNVNYARASVIKGYLVRNMRKEISMSLDTQRTDPAYRLGRLFAALEKTQKDALGDSLNATIRDRFYASASATPGAVFPRLLRTYQHHLAKLDGGRKVNREKLVQEVLAPLTSFPAHFGLTDQGLFALGYYHQTRAFYAGKQPTSVESAERSES